MLVSGVLAPGALILRRFVNLAGQDYARWAAVVAANSYVIALALPTLGVLTLVNPPVARLLLKEDSSVPRTTTDVALGDSTALGTPAALLYAGECLLLVLSWVLVAVSGWRNLAS